MLGDGGGKGQSMSKIRVDLAFSRTLGAGVLCRMYSSAIAGDINEWRLSKLVLQGEVYTGRGGDSGGGLEPGSPSVFAVGETK